MKNVSPASLYDKQFIQKIVNLFSNRILQVFFIVLMAILLRFYWLDSVPPSLNWDEAAIAWNGYSIGQTHLDEYGTKFPLTFRSFGDYKAPFLIYIEAVVTRLFGLNIWTIRIPIAVAGVITVLLMYFLALEIGNLLALGRKELHTFSLLVLAFAAFSPWHVFFSRGAFEVTLSLLFIVLGMWLFLVSLKHLLLLPLSMLAFMASLYSYHSPKIFVPLFIFTLLIVFLPDLVKRSKKFMLHTGITIAGLVLVAYAAIPLIKVTLFDKGAERLGVSIFYDDERKLKPFNMKLISQLGSNIVAHANPLFMLKGQPQLNMRMSLKHFGKMTVFEYLMVLSGLLLLWSKKSSRKIALLLSLWILFGMVPAVIGKEVPHSIRTLNLWPAFMVAAGYGTVQLFTIGRKYPAYLLAGILFIYMVQYALFLREYFIDFPRYAAADWQYGYKQVAEYASKFEYSSDKIIITSFYGQPHVFIYVHQKQDPLHVLWGGMGKYQFREINWDGDKFAKNTLLIGTPDELPNIVPPDIGELIGNIMYPDGSEAFRIVKINP